MEPGQVIAGKFRVERVLGRGGMGVVLVATHLQLDQTVALKFLHDDIAWDPAVVERLVREARASAKLKSEHACRVMDVGQLERGAPYIVMELLEGHDLASVIRRAPLPAAVAAQYVLQACVALAEAHAAKIVHRDLKPSNLFVTERLDGSPLIKVLDFGIAKAPSKADFEITRTSAVMGSPGYMSPEQLRSSKDVDARTDIWSLGVILYEAVSQRLPFRAESITELAVKVSMDPFEPLGPTDARLAAVIARCLEKPVANRYQTVAELAADLAPIAGQLGATSVQMISRLASGRVSAKSAVPAVDSADSGVAPTLALDATEAPVAVVEATAPARRDPTPVLERGPEPPRAPPTTLSGAAASHAVASPRRSRWLVPAVLGAIAVVAIVIGVAVVGGGKGKQVARSTAVPEDAEESPPPDAAPVATARVRVAISGNIANAKVQLAIGNERFPSASVEPTELVVLVQGNERFMRNELANVRGFLEDLARDAPPSKASLRIFDQETRQAYAGDLSGIATKLGDEKAFEGRLVADLWGALSATSVELRKRKGTPKLLLVLVASNTPPTDVPAMQGLRARFAADGVDVHVIGFGADALDSGLKSLTPHLHFAGGAESRSVALIVKTYAWAETIIGFDVPVTILDRPRAGAVVIGRREFALTIARNALNRVSINSN